MRKQINYARRIEDLEYAARELARELPDASAGATLAMALADKLAELLPHAREVNEAAYGQD